MAVPELLQISFSGDVNAEPKIYGSPAKSKGKRECMRVEKVGSIERLMRQRELDEEAAAAREATDADGDSEEGDGAAATVHTYKKSQYWSKEIEEKLGLAGADPYGLLELEERRWRATPDEIRKSYRRLILTMHPDKKAAGDVTPKRKEKKEEKEAKENKANDEEGADKEEEEEEDEEFKMLSAAWELLGNAETRRQYDSIDNFNDFLPSAFRPKPAEPEHFFRTFGPPFARQAKFSNATPVPALGDAATPMEQVNKFYKFWFSFSSWRDFGLMCEYDYKEAEDREERRWMQRQNKNYAGRVKKDEVGRVSAFVQLAYEHDPRVKAEKEEKAAAKLKAKDDKERAIKEAKEAEENAKKEKEAAANAVKAEAAAANAVEKEKAAASKKEKEKQRSMLKKARKEFKTLAEAPGAWVERAADLDVVAAVLSLEELTELTTTLAAGVSDAATAALDAAKAKAMA